MKTSYIVLLAFIVSLMASGAFADEKSLRITTHEMKPFHYMENGNVEELY